MRSCGQLLLLALASTVVLAERATIFGGPGNYSEVADADSAVGGSTSNGTAGLTTTTILLIALPIGIAVLTGLAIALYCYSKSRNEKAHAAQAQVAHAVPMSAVTTAPTAPTAQPVIPVVV